MDRCAPPQPSQCLSRPLRNIAASLVISAGANVNAVQRKRRQAAAAMTLDTYADLFDNDVDAIVVALNDARRASIAVKMQSKASDREI